MKGFAQQTLTRTHSFADHASITQFQNSLSFAFICVRCSRKGAKFAARGEPKLQRLPGWRFQLVVAVVVVVVVCAVGLPAAARRMLAGFSTQRSIARGPQPCAAAFPCVFARSFRLNLSTSRAACIMVTPCGSGGSSANPPFCLSNSN